MSSDHPRPELSAVDRKYGRYDFKRFDHLVSHDASLADASLGKIHVDCKFLFKKSKWGTLGDQDPAGIIYLDLSFNQPSHCRLKSATVQVTLDDDDQHLVRQFPSNPLGPPVQIVKYGPRHMTGEPQYERSASHTSYIPTIEVAPFGGAGGVGKETAKETIRECRWMFESHLKTGSRKRGKTNWAYKVLQWHVTENELEYKSMHSNTVHTAFSFVHGGQPFFMRVEVSGKLESRASDLHHQIKHKMRKLKFPSKPNSSGYATTLINFNGRDKFTMPLDSLNQGLELAMENENMTAPVEIKRIQRPTFSQDPSPPPAPQPSIQPQTGDAPPLVEELEDHTAPTIENIASLSSKWLMAPPIVPFGTVSESGLEDNKPTGPYETVHAHRSRSEHGGEDVPQMEVHLVEQNSQATSQEMEPEPEESRVLVVANGLQSVASPDKGDLRVVILVIVVLHLATLYWVT